MDKIEYEKDEMATFPDERLDAAKTLTELCDSPKQAFAAGLYHNSILHYVKAVKNEDLFKHLKDFPEILEPYQPQIIQLTEEYSEKLGGIDFVNKCLEEIEFKSQQDEYVFLYMIGCFFQSNLNKE